MRHHRDKRVLSCAAVAAIVMAAALPSSAAPEDRRERLTSDDFEALHRLIRREEGESRWLEIDWHPSVWEARRKAAAEGKPIFILAGSGGAPAAGC